MGNAKAIKRTKGMFNGKYTLIFADGKYSTNLGKRWKVWQNTKNVGGTYCCWLSIPNKGKWIVM